MASAALQPCWRDREIRCQHQPSIAARLSSISPQSRLVYNDSPHAAIMIARTGDFAALQRFNAETAICKRCSSRSFEQLG
jgi:hypothetical protein